MAKTAVNPFDALAAPAKPASKKSTKIAATVTDEIKSAVDIVISHKAEIARLDMERVQFEEKIIDHVRPQQDALARAGQFAKSFAVEGKTGNLTYVSADKFSVPKETETQQAIKDLIGAKRFEEWFSSVRTISLKPAVQDNSDLINKIVAAVTAAGLNLAEAFEVTDVLKAKPDLDQKQYELKDKQLMEFRSLVKQQKIALR
jgi:hypothetical protein